MLMFIFSNSPLCVCTFTNNDAPEPPPPPGISVLCCRHVAAVGGANGVDFVRLPYRDMRWAPVPLMPADPARRPPHPPRATAPEVLHGEALRTSKRGSAAGLSGATVELYKLLLDDAAALEAFTYAVNVAARAQAPQVALDAMALFRG